MIRVIYGRYLVLLLMNACIVCTACTTIKTGERFDGMYKLTTTLKDGKELTSYLRFFSESSDFIWRLGRSFKNDAEAVEAISLINNPNLCSKKGNDFSEEDRKTSFSCRALGGLGTDKRKNQFSFSRISVPIEGKKVDEDVLYFYFSKGFFRTKGKTIYDGVIPLVIEDDGSVKDVRKTSFEQIFIPFAKAQSQGN